MQLTHATGCIVPHSAPCGQNVDRTHTSWAQGPNSRPLNTPDHRSDSAALCEADKNRFKFSDGRSTQLQKVLNSGLTAGVASSFADLVFGSEELGPVHGLGEAQVCVVLQHHMPSTHLLQRAQAKPAQVLHIYHHQTVLTESRAGHL